jgi:hypothetical protein
MSHLDVPGYGTAANEELKLGCWGEHQDGSLVFVASVENHRVVFQIFDLSAGRVIEYRDAIPQIDFENKFSWSSPNKIQSGPWRWKDKTPFPWDKVIAAGAPSGTGFASVQDVLDHAADIKASRDRLIGGTAAQIVASDLKLQGMELLREEIERLFRQYGKRPMRRLAHELSDAIVRRFGGNNPPPPS